jgi:hypothetical protein
MENRTSPIAAGPLWVALLLPFLAGACTLSPLSGVNALAIAPPSPAPGTKALPDDVAARLRDGLRKRVRSATRFREVSSDGASGSTVVVHPRIREFQAPGPAETGAARLDYLFTDPRGRPVMGTSILTLVSTGGGDRLIEEAGEDFLKFVHRMGGLPRGRPPEAEGTPPVETVHRPWPAPAAPWPAASAPGRFFARARLALLPLFDSAAGKGRGAPAFPDIFSSGASVVLESGYAATPGLDLFLGTGRDRFRGRRYATGGLVMDFEPLILSRLYAGLRLSLPLKGPRGKRWWSTWEPFEDTRVLLLSASVASGAAVHEAVAADVVEDTSGQVPALSPGDRIPYYKRGGVFFGEVLLGLTVRLGEGRVCAFSGSVFTGFFLATAPASTGPGSDSQTLRGMPVAMEVSIRF